MRARPVLALLPQLLVLGLGRSVVLCIGDGGHAQIEVAASLCCAGAGSLAPARVGAEHSKVAGQDDGASDCDACTDLLIVVSTPCSRVEDGNAPPPPGPAAAPPAAPAPATSRGHGDLATRRASRGSPEPPHLLALKSVRLRC
jgi:hypothetical protein